MKTSVEFAASLADFVDAVAFNYDWETKTVVSFKPIYNVDEESELKTFVVPAGRDVDRASRDSVESTAVATIGFQKYVGSPFDETQVAELARLVENVQSQLIGETIRCEDEEFVVKSVFCDALFDQKHLVESSLFTGILTVSATTHYWTE